LAGELLPEFIERVLASELLDEGLVEIAPRGAGATELARPSGLPADLRSILAWRNGMDLDVIRILPVPREAEVERSVVLNDGRNGVVFGSDPAGFTFVVSPDGAVYSVDADGCDEKKLAQSVREFLCEVVFGRRSADFLGEDWAKEVAAAGL